MWLLNTTYFVFILVSTTLLKQACFACKLHVDVHGCEQVIYHIIIISFSRTSIKCEGDL